MGRAIGALWFGLVLALAAWCAAEDPPRPAADDLSKLSLEELMNVEVVYGPSRYAQKASEAPSSVTIVTAADIRQFGYRSLADVLRSVRGFYVTYDRNYAYVGVRGFGRPGDYNTRVLVLVDGHRLNDNVYDQALVDDGFVVDLDTIERVEIVRGPNFSIYGTSAFFPVVVNVITRRSADQRPEVSAEVASFGTYAGRAAYGGRLGDALDVVASASLLRSRGQDLYFPEFDTPATNHGVAVHADDEYAYRLFGSATYRDFTVEAAHSVREKGIPTAAFGTVFDDRRTRTWDERSFVDVRAEHAFGPSLTLFGRAHYDHAYYHGDYATDYPPVTLNRDIGDGAWWGVETFALYSGLARHTVIAGAEFQDDAKQDQRNYDVDPAASYLDLHNRGHRWAVFAQDEYRVAKNVILNLGLRHDALPGLSGRDSPRVALIYNPSTATSVKLLFGRAFRPPNQYERFYATNYPVQRPNPDLRPETIETYEIVVDNAIGRDLRATAYLFEYRIEDLISYVTDPVDGSQQYRNAGDIESRGVEFELAGRFGERVTGRVSYSFANTRNVDVGAPLTNSPRHLLKANLAFPVWRDRLSAGVEAQYTSARLTLAGSETGGFTVANVTLTAPRLADGLDLTASVYNLFDKAYADPASEEHVENVIPQDGRSFRIKLRWRF
jgi:outer membrane receptor for ferrienterochelin and colicins